MSFNCVRMKTKYFLIYVFVGIAFLAVSAWVYFSRGKNAKAIQAKYKLGGIMLTCMAMLSVASCGELGDPPQMMCYDPAPPQEVFIDTERHDAEMAYLLAPGEILTIKFKDRIYGRYQVVLRKSIDFKEGDILQTVTFEREGENEFDYQLEYAPADMDYTGPVMVTITGYLDGSEEGEFLYRSVVVVTAREN